MRLLSAATYKLVGFKDDSISQYAILSHTWGKQEASFHDVQVVSHWLTRSGVLPYKIEQACRQAMQDGLRYVWIDTCCIDKSSSAELQEAINSMYRFYEEAEICYVYLED